MGAQVLCRDPSRANGARNNMWPRSKVDERGSSIALLLYDSGPTSLLGPPASGCHQQEGSDGRPPRWTGKSVNEKASPRNTGDDTPAAYATGEWNEWENISVKRMATLSSSDKDQSPEFRRRTNATSLSLSVTLYFHPTHRGS